MPEGDTIYRAAAALRIALVGRVTTMFSAQRLVGPRPQVGSTIESVDSRGKHLDIVWDDGIVLHTHMRMTGSWHLYRPGETWRKSSFQARAVIETDEWVAVCFNAPVVETYRLADRRRHPGAGGLGPDLCQPDADLELCAQMMVSYPDQSATVAEVLLDQRIACGVGNVYKSETLFACRISPFAEIRTIGLDDCRRLIATAAGQLRANLHRPTRVTAPEVPGGLAVYGRANDACFVCHTPIKMARHGAHQRSSYWCPTCQSFGERRDHERLGREESMAWSSSARAARLADPHPAAARYLEDALEARAARAAQARRQHPDVTPSHGGLAPRRGLGNGRFRRLS